MKPLKAPGLAPGKGRRKGDQKAHGAHGSPGLSSRNPGSSPKSSMEELCLPPPRNTFIVPHHVPSTAPGPAAPASASEQPGGQRQAGSLQPLTSASMSLWVLLQEVGDSEPPTLQNPRLRTLPHPLSLLLPDSIPLFLLGEPSKLIWRWTEAPVSQEGWIQVVGASEGCGTGEGPGAGKYQAWSYQGQGQGQGAGWETPVSGRSVQPIPTPPPISPPIKVFWAAAQPPALLPRGQEAGLPLVSWPQVASCCDSCH